MKRCLLFFFIFAFLIPYAYGDIIYLQDGSIVKGKITDQDENKVSIEKQGGIQVDIPWHKIKKIEKGGDSAASIYKAKLNQIPPGDAEGHYQLGVWLESINLNKEAYEEFTKAIIIDPNHSQARQKMGYILTSQGWKIPTEKTAKEEEPEVVPAPVSPLESSFFPEVLALLKASQSRHETERMRAFEALKKLREKYLETYWKSLFQGDEQDRKKALNQLKKIDPNFVAELEKNPALNEKTGSQAKSVIEKFLQETFDKQVLAYLNYQVKSLIARLKSLYRKLEQLVSFLPEGKARQMRSDYLKKWEEARKEALRVIFDKKIYPDEDHGRVGQPVVDEKVKALKQVYEFFDLLIKRDLERILRLSPEEAARILDQMDALQGQLKDYNKLLAANGKEAPQPPPVNSQVKALISYRAGKIQDAQKIASGMDPWGQSLLKRIQSQRIMDYNRQLASQKNSPLTGIEADQARITNEYRISMGRLPLEICPKLVRCARGHSEEMVKLGYFDHTSPVEKNKTPSLRAQNEGHDGYVGENIFTSSGGATALGSFDAWYHSSGHHRNMLSEDWTCLGVGHHTINMTQNFGKCKNCSR